MCNQKSGIAEFSTPITNGNITKILIIIFRNDSSHTRGRPNYECLGIICGNHLDLGDKDYKLKIPFVREVTAHFGSGLLLSPYTQFIIHFDDTNWIETEWF